MPMTRNDEADLAVMLDFITGGRIPKGLCQLAQKTPGLQGFTGGDEPSVEGEVYPA
jgi:hypothetical protein